MLSVITCTGGRPAAFALCEKFMARQTLRPDQWLVVDDVAEATPITMGQTVIRPWPRWSGESTLGRNILAALPMVTGSKIVFIEDDDYIPPDYLKHMSTMLNAYPLAGEAPARYYNVATRQYRQLRNTAHASLGQTGIQRSLLPTLAAICERERKFIDIPLWRHHGSIGWLTVSTVVGVKGLPGRPGIGIGHRPAGHWPVDGDGSVLRSWIGEDAALYESFAEKAAA